MLNFSNLKKDLLIAVFTAIMLAIGASVHAGTVTWDGSASTVWTNGANWIGDAPPNTNDDVVIDGNYTYAPILNLSGGAVTINSLSLGENNFSKLTVSNGNSVATQLTITANCTIGTTGTLTTLTTPPLKHTSS